MLKITKIRFYETFGRWFGPYVKKSSKMFACTFALKPEGCIESIYSVVTRPASIKNGLEQKKAFTGFVSNTNMGVISLFRYTGIIGRHDVMWKRSTQWKTQITKDIKKTAYTDSRKYAKLQYCVHHSL